MLHSNGLERLLEESKVKKGNALQASYYRSWCAEQLSLQQCEEGSAQTTLLSELGSGR